jgi:DNA-binding transcriptional LysR family regulator
MLDLRTLEAFCWVARLGGFGRAAERMHTTQPAISARIARLETACGQPLFLRAPRRRPSLTPAGEALFARAERLLALGEEIEALLAAPAAATGRLRIGVAETIVHTWLADLLRRLHAGHPGVTPEISVDISVRLREALLAGEIDLALLLGPVGGPGVTDLPLCAYPLCFAASPALGIASGAPAELARFPLITYPRTTRPHAELAAALNRPELPPVRIFANTSLASIVRMATDGIGVCVVPEPVIAAELADGRLLRLAGAPVLSPLGFTASWLRGPGSLLAARVAALAAELASPPGS